MNEKHVHEVQLSKTRKRENAKRENGFRVRVSKKLKFFRVLFLRFRVSKTRNGKRENAKIDFAFFKSVFKLFLYFEILLTI